MDIKLCSFNCKGFNISKVKHINEILKSCDILMIQETWLLTSQIGTINKEFSNYNTCGISGMNEKSLISGRPHGGCSFLFRKSISSNISFIDLNSHRVCCIKLITESCTVFIFNVYLPCDTMRNDNLQDYNEVLSTISTCLSQYNAEYCVIAGDLNTDLSRVNSGNTISLKAFVDEENLCFGLDKFTSRIPYTFTGIRNNHSLIDHFIVSQNLVEEMTDCYISPSIDNLSDHTPLYCTLSNICTPAPCTDESTPAVRPKTQWSSATDEQINSYKFDLDSLLSAFSLPPDIAHCVSDVCSHEQEISMFHDKIMSSTIEAMHANILKSSDAKKRKVVPGWDREIENA